MNPLARWLHSKPPKGSGWVPYVLVAVGAIAVAVGVISRIWGSP